MPKFRARPIEVEAFQHTTARGPIPAPFTSVKAMTAQSGEVGIGYDAVGQLLVPAGGTIATCRIGDYVLMQPSGDLAVMKKTEFEATYEALDAPAEEAAPEPVAAEEAPAETPAAGGRSRRGAAAAETPAETPAADDAAG